MFNIFKWPEHVLLIEMSIGPKYEKIEDWFFLSFFPDVNLPQEKHTEKWWSFFLVRKQ